MLKLGPTAFSRPWNAFGLGRGLRVARDTSKAETALQVFSKPGKMHSGFGWSPGSSINAFSGGGGTALNTRIETSG